MTIRNARFCLLIAALAPFAYAGSVEASQEAPPETRSSGAPTVARSAEETYPILDIGTLVVAPRDSALVGREIAAQDVRVKQVANNGFWVSAAQGLSQVFVVPAEGSLITVRPGDVVSLHGEVRLPATKRHNNADHNPTSENVTPYVYAYTVRPAW